jgi:hypothetical protein
MRRASLSAACAVALIGTTVVSTPPVRAQSTHPASRAEPQPPGADLRPTLDETDELAVLDAIHVTLSQVGDGSSYVWHRHHGRLSGVMQPTQSFLGKNGAPCRHLIVMLMAGRHVQRTEGIACRIEGGRWALTG